LKIKKILEKYSNDFLQTDRYIDSKSKGNKPSFHLYGNKTVSLFGKKPKNTYIAGIIRQKNYVSFYLSPIYSHPNLFENISSDLRRFLKGNSCFNINKSSTLLFTEIEDALKLGINKYKKIE
jgi:hypothetical protein